MQKRLICFGRVCTYTRLSVFALDQIEMNIVSVVPKTLRCLLVLLEDVVKVHVFGLMYFSFSSLS